MEKRSKKSTGHLSKVQKEKLLDLMRERPHLRSGKFSKDFTMKDGQQEWEIIETILNAIPGSKKDWRLWRKTWQDLQSKAKSKKAVFNKASNKTGGGPPPDPIDDFEEGIISLINKNSVVGHEAVAESIAEFEIEVLVEEDAVAVEIPALQPPPEFRNEDVNQIIIPDENQTITDNQQSESQEPRINEKEKRTATKKINMKSLLKEKIDLKRKLVESKINFQNQFIKIQEERNNILKDILSKFNLEKNL